MLKALGLISLMILVMIVLGGVTRLTGSGLSITHWKPISGILPPLNEADWRTLFSQYQTSPEYLNHSIQFNSIEEQPPDSQWLTDDAEAVFME